MHNSITDFVCYDQYPGPWATPDVLTDLSTGLDYLDNYHNKRISITQHLMNLKPLDYFILNNEFLGFVITVSFSSHYDPTILANINTTDVEYQPYFTY